MNSLYFNNKNSYEDLELFILKDYDIPISQEIIENIEVEGRKMGTLTRKTGQYKDLIIERQFKFIDMEDYKQKILKLSEWLEEIKDNKLWFNNDEGKCYFVKNVICPAFSNMNQFFTQFSIKFICEPFARMRNDYFITVNNGDNIINNGAVECEPVIRLTVPTKQNIQIIINDNTFQINDAIGIVIIDSALFTVKNENGNLKSIGNFPILEKGNNTISWSGTLTKFEIQKRILYRG